MKTFLSMVFFMVFIARSKALVGRSVNSATLSRTTSAIGKACERRTSGC